MIVHLHQKLFDVSKLRSIRDDIKFLYIRTFKYDNARCGKSFRGENLLFKLLSLLQRCSASLYIYILLRTDLRLSWKMRAGTRAREIPLVSKCVRLIGRRGTRARISRVHSRLPRIITHAWICRRLLRPPPRHTASPPRTQAVCGRRNCIPLFFLVFPWNLQVTAKVVDRRRSSSRISRTWQKQWNIQIIRYPSLKCEGDVSEWPWTIGLIDFRRGVIELTEDRGSAQDPTKAYSLTSKFDVRRDWEW